MKVTILTNIGTSEKWVAPYQEGDTPEVDDAIAARLIARGWAEEHDPAKQASKEEAAREAAIQAAIPAAREKLAQKEIAKEAEKRLKSGKTGDPAKDFSKDPHTTVKAEK